MGKPVVYQRLFVGLYPTLEAARSLNGQLKGLELPSHRPVLPEQVHLTAHFIGDVGVSALEEVTESVARSAAGLASFGLEPQRLISLPERGPARLVALTTDAPPTLLELHRRLVHRLAAKPRAQTADRFLPHITLCRFSAPAQALSVDVAANAVPFRVDTVWLMRSVLRPEGAEHIPVMSFPLEAE